MSLRPQTSAGVKESQIGTEIASERLVNLQDVRPERSLFKTSGLSFFFCLCLR